MKISALAQLGISVGERPTVNFEADLDSVEMLNPITEQFRLPNSSWALISRKIGTLSEKKYGVAYDRCSFCPQVLVLEHGLKASQYDKLCKMIRVFQTR